jgi:hypothetical protein
VKSKEKNTVQKSNLTPSFEEEKLRDGIKAVQSELFSVPFQCTCSYCLYHGWDPSENARLGSDMTESRVTLGLNLFSLSLFWWALGV